jgi:hypothetical protein
LGDPVALASGTTAAGLATAAPQVYSVVSVHHA